MLLLSILLLACFGHGFLWVGWVNRIHAWAGPRWIIDLLTLFCVFAFVGIPLSIAYSWTTWQLGSVLHGSAEHATPDLVVASTWQPDFWQSIYLNLCALGGGAVMLWQLLGPRRADQPKTLKDRQVRLLNLASMSPSELPTDRLTQLMCRLPANQVLKLSVEKKKIALPRLDTAFHGLSIVHISDLHMTGKIDRAFYRLVADEVNALQPDLIALTGDILENEICRPWFVESLGRMQSRFGKFFILGNHDRFVDSAQTRKSLSDLGWTDVGGHSILATFHDAPVLVAGNELPWFSPPANLADSVPIEPSPAATLPSEHQPLRLVLTHSPDQFAWCRQRNIDLVLAGHTHGGQICLPLLGPVACPSKHGTRYAGGVFREENTVMHVTRGISGEMPIRWNCPPELALLELVQD